jgi:hypothetical protein
VTYRAAAAFPYPCDRARVMAALRGQLCVMAAADNAALMWASLCVEGPTEVPDGRGRTWFEWVATAEAREVGANL